MSCQALVNGTRTFFGDLGEHRVEEAVTAAEAGGWQRRRAMPPGHLGHIVRGAGAGAYARHLIHRI